MKIFPAIELNSSKANAGRSLASMAQWLEHSISNRGVASSGLPSASQIRNDKNIMIQNMFTIVGHCEKLDPPITQPGAPD